MIINAVTVHVSDSPQGRGDDAETIHNWHVQRGFDGIGYHFVILEDGSIQAGRPEYWQGAHVSGHNQSNIGICLIGEGGDATDEQLDSLFQLIRGLENKYGKLDVSGHRDYTETKTCPGFDVKPWYEDRLNG